MWLYARQTAWLREENAAGLNGLSKEKTDVALLGMAMPWWPWAFAVMCGLLFLFVRLRYRRNLTQLLENTPP